MSSKPTQRELRKERALEVFADPPQTIPGQSEAAYLLKTKLRLSRAEIADVLGLSFRQVQARLNRYKFFVAEKAIPTEELNWDYIAENPLVELEEEEQERLEKNALNREAVQTVRRNIFEDKLAEAIAPIVAQAQANVPAIERLHRDYCKKHTKAPKTAEQDVLAVMSDLHLELNTHGHPALKSYVAVENFVATVLRLTELHRQTNPVNTLHLLALGDLIQGTANYPNQRWDVLIPAIDQAEKLTQLLVTVIERFALHFKNIEIWWGNGNHEYLNPKKQNTDPDQASWGTVIARALKWAFRGNKRIKFHIPETWYSVAEIKGSRFLLTHGHAVKGSGNFDGLVAQCRKWADVLPAHDYVVMGHFHRAASLPLPKAFGSSKHRCLYMNGTAVESDEFLEQFGGSPVSQWWCLFVSEKRGITAEYKVNLYE